MPSAGEGDAPDSEPSAAGDVPGLAGKRRETRHRPPPGRGGAANRVPSARVLERERAQRQNPARGAGGEMGAGLGQPESRGREKEKCKS